MHTYVYIYIYMYTVVEVVSAFPAVCKLEGNAWASFSLADGLEHSYYANQWQVGVLHHRNYSGHKEHYTSAICAADGSIVTVSSWPEEPCSGEAKETLTYRQRVCQEDSTGMTFMHVCNGTRLVQKVWVLDGGPRTGLGGPGSGALPRPSQASSDRACPDR